MVLSSEQQAAVRRTGQDACCVAGPGSGKTRVLVERYAWLVEKGADPGAILAITFTDKAATEIKERLVKRFGSTPELRHAVEQAPVSTIHSFCKSLLQEHAIRAALDPQFEVMDEREARVEQAAAMETVLDRVAADRRGEFLALVEAWSPTDLALPLLSIHETLRMGGGARAALRTLPAFDPEDGLNRLESEVRQMLAVALPPKTEPQRRRLDGAREWLSLRAELTPLEWLAASKIDQRVKREDPIYDYIGRARDIAAEAQRNVVGAMFEKERVLVRDVLIAFEDEYERRKRQRAAMDFEDLQEKALSLLERDSEVRALTQNRYEAVLMDELQDTNPVQWRILNHIRRDGRFFAVGDINQSIYGFRHAVPQQFTEYQCSVERAGGIVDRLKDNYRSRKRILDAVVSVTVTTPCEGVAAHELNSKGTFSPASGAFVEVQRIENGEADMEPLWIARRLRELQGTLMVKDPPRPVRFGDMAVLARTGASFDALEDAFQQYGIPYVLKRGRNFFTEAEILDLTNFLRVLENPSNEIALFALLRSPLFGVGDEEMLRLRLKGGLAPQAAMRRIAEASAFREEIPADRILARILDETGYLRTLSRRARANVDKFFALLRDLDRTAPGDLAAHLKQIDDLRGSGREPGAPELEATDAVQVLSVHSAKGLEFPVVVVASMQKGAGASGPPINWSEETGLGLRWRLPNTSAGADDPAMAAGKSRTTQREREEEFRLLYVAMTRAEERLILSWADSTRSKSLWPGQVETGLGIEWPAGLNEPVENGGLRVSRLSGHPDPLPPPVFLDQPVQPLEIAPLREAGQAGSTIAVTALTQFGDCPRRYFLNTLLRWPVAGETTESAAAALGTETHDFLSGKRTGAGEEARSLAATFTNSELGRRAARSPHSEREFDFLVELEGTLVRGQIDLWFEEAGQTIVLDYKTDQQLDEQRLRAYRMQLVIYALALEKLTGSRPAEAWLFSLRTGEAHHMPVGSEKDSAARSLLQDFAAAEEGGDYPLRPASHCTWCKYRAGACPVE